MPQKYDVDEPILVLVRRGRKGRGFTVCPVEDVSNPAVCSDSKDMGEVIEEFLNDENQPRVNVKDLLGAATDHDTQSESPPGQKGSGSTRGQQAQEPEEDEEDEEEDEAEGGIFVGVAGSEDPASQLLVNILSGAINQGRKMSSTRVRSRGRRVKRKKTS